MIGRDVPSWKRYSTEGLEQFLARCRVYAATDPDWKIGRAVIADICAELRLTRNRHTMTPIRVDTCRHESRGKVCGDSITQGLLTGVWFHSARMFDYRNDRPADRHTPVGPTP